MRKSYQNIDIDGVDVGYTRNKKGSKFCNEGKWDNYIKPLLPDNPEDMTFVELGSNAGLFLKLADQYGFRNVVGVDKSRYTHEWAKKYRDQNDLDYKIINERVDGDFNYNQLPVADVTVMSNFHYYLQVDHLLRVLDKMRYKTRYCIVVTAEIEKGAWRARADLPSIRHYFKEWREVASISPIPTEGDSFPRVMSSIVFESDLVRKPIDLLREVLVSKGKRVGNVEELIDMVIAKDSIDNLEETSYFKTAESLHTRWKKKDIVNWVTNQVDSLYDIKKNGVKEPIFISSDNQIIDGKHRMLMLKAWGYRSVIARLI